MIEFTSIIPISCKKTPLSLDWANKNFELTYQGELDKYYLIDDTKDCRLSWFMNEDGSDFWRLTMYHATFKLDFIEEVECLLKTFCINCKRNDILDE